MLPDRDGLTLLERFKELNEGTEVVILTGHGGVSEAVAATKARAFLFVQKPVDVDTLLSVVGRAVEQAYTTDIDVRKAITDDKLRENLPETVRERPVDVVCSKMRKHETVDPTRLTKAVEKTGSTSA